jgi:CTP synthase
VQYHPEFKSAPLACQPIFKGFVAAALAHSRNGGRVREVEHA